MFLAVGEIKKKNLIFINLFSPIAIDQCPLRGRYPLL